MKSSEVHFTWEISFNNMNHVLKQSAKAHRPPVCLSFFRVLLTVLVVLWFFSFDFLSRSYMPKIFFFFFCCSLFLLTDFYSMLCSHAAHQVNFCCSFLRISMQCYALIPHHAIGAICQPVNERETKTKRNQCASFFPFWLLSWGPLQDYAYCHRPNTCMPQGSSIPTPTLLMIRTNTGPYYKDEHWSVL